VLEAPSDATFSDPRPPHFALDSRLRRAKLVFLSRARFGDVLLSAAIRLIPPPRPYAAAEEAL
jgi:hypothetical protein